MAMFERKNGHWGYEPEASPTGFRKTAHQCGPIDDAFMSSFYCIAPEASGGNPAIREYAAKSLDRFDREWDRYFRGSVRRIAKDQIAETKKQNNFISVALFGDPGSNPAIAEVLPRLPIRWTSERLEVNGKTYDARTHIPVMIYPSREFGTYVVLNSGHTFHEADIKGTNALLYPRLGDWAVLKLKPTEKDPLAAEVVDAGLFDSNWLFRK